jgi:hypothetical protein
MNVPAMAAAARMIGPAMALLVISTPARAHRASDSTLLIRPENGQGRWDIAVRDLHTVIGLDADGNGDITHGEIRARARDIAAYALPRLVLRPGGEARVCPLTAGQIDTVAHSDGAYVALPFSIGCALGASGFSVEYALLFDIDPSHRGLLYVERRSGNETAVMSAEHRRYAAAPEPGFSRSTISAALVSIRRFVGEGVLHVWGGLDHVLFLIALLLPVGAQASSMRFVLVEVAKIVTAFTAAHSLTLSLAALGVVSLPSRLVESAIAASVVIAAVNNFKPLFGPSDQRWPLALALGLLHGFGFSSVLADIGLPRDGFLAGLLGFNLGVELGQLAIVAVFVPLAFVARRTVAYRRFALIGGSGAIALLSIVWLIERVFDVTFIS